MTINITAENFEAEVLKSEKPVIIDFWASWCGPCKMMAPIFEGLSEEVPEVKFGKLNVDEQMALAGEFQVMNIPTMIIFKGGQEVKRIVGLTPPSSLKNVLSQI